MSALLLSLQIGQPAMHGSEGTSDPLRKAHITAIHKQPVAGPVRVLAETLEGDAVANRKVHGGRDKSICVYASEHYPHWQKFLSQKKSEPYGAFGENFTTQGLLESEVCVGDVFTIGSAIVEVSQPRQPCFTLSRRWQDKRFSIMVDEAGLTGWYFRILQQGEVQAGDTFTRIKQPYPQWTIARANDIMMERETDLDSLQELSVCPALAASWQRELQGKLNRL
jgi:MOSC domain-containing protein YiiM